MMIHLTSFTNLTTESILLGIQISIQQYRKTQNACHEDAKIHCILTLHIECVDNLLRRNIVQFTNVLESHKWQISEQGIFTHRSHKLTHDSHSEEYGEIFAK